MMFENEHGLATDGIAGPLVWHQLLTDALSGHRHTAAYSYVLVHTHRPMAAAQRSSPWRNPGRWRGMQLEKAFLFE